MRASRVISIRLGSLFVLIAFMVMAAGCQPESKDTTPQRDGKSGTPQGIASAPLEPNIGRVVPLFDAFNPWIWNEDRSRPRGITTKQLYLFGPDEKGVFGDGVIRAKVFIAELEPGTGKKVWRELKQWSYDVEQAKPFRALRRGAGGWGYRLFLVWGDLNLADKDIRVIIEFERRDGIVVKSDKNDFRVPARGS